MNTPYYTYVSEGCTYSYFFEYGTAAHKNRGSFSGEKVHALRCEYLVNVDDSVTVQPGTHSDLWRKTRKPVLTSCAPVCRCTDGQRAGKPVRTKTEADVTCTKCLGKLSSTKAK